MNYRRYQKGENKTYGTIIYTGIITVEVISTRQFLDVMKKNGILQVEIDEQLSHNLASMLFNGMIEVFKHDMTYEHAKEYVTKLQVFYTAGWMKLFEG